MFQLAILIAWVISVLVYLSKMVFSKERAPLIIGFKSGLASCVAIFMVLGLNGYAILKMNQPQHPNADGMDYGFAAIGLSVFLGSVFGMTIGIYLKNRSK